MQDNALYTYHCRPGYASQTLLIEFIRGAEHKTFIADLLAAIKEIQPRLEGRNNLWMHDEIDYTIHSNAGTFTLSKDIWDFAFITANENQACIIKIDTLFQRDVRFEKTDVDFNKYR